MYEVLNGLVQENLQQISVVIVDDHSVFVDALNLVFHTQRDLNVVGTAGTCSDCLEIVKRTQPLVLILDVDLPDGDGIAMVPDVIKASPVTNVLILTSFQDESTIRRAIQAGVSGYLPKNIHLRDVMEAVRKAATGEIVMLNGTLTGVLNRTRVDPKAVNPQVTISQREMEILQLLSHGRSAKEISELLNISLSTTRTHIRNLMQKLQVSSQLQAVSLAMRLGWIRTPL